MKNTISILTLLLLVSCNIKQKDSCNFKGKTDNLKDGTKLYLVSPLTNKRVDSSVVKNNSFLFEIELENAPSLLVLENKSEYKYLWLENSTMTFDASNTSFNDAKITGSKTQDIFQKLNDTKKSLSEKEKLKVDIEFIEKNPESNISSALLAFNMYALGKEKSTAFFKKLSLNNKNSEFGKVIADYIKLNEYVKIGDHFIDFEMNDINGNSKKLSTFKGKTILLEFWASWCVPCRQENPNLLKTYEEFNTKGFEIFAVSLDNNKNNWIKAIKEDNLKWENVSDLKGNSNTAAFTYGVHSVPNNFLIDENGLIIAQNVRGNELHNKLTEIFYSDRFNSLDKISSKFFKAVNTSNFEQIKAFFSASILEQLTDSVLQSIINKINYSDEIKFVDSKVISGKNNTSNLRLSYKHSKEKLYYIHIVYNKANKIENIYFENIK
ncbi:TlpA disulfide reductase family protein [Wenyingzhuangia sp. chi5]|uniref:TlpA disulfide reductase family protein n=1 Tax=Wenyingzhuangia gilva TaxID=3057677 RepID=A0ABT8VVC4_9FLAO|nr:TlpA disulfide reductase family protein [Wenyingzhuangia sp. chi5]MDO3695932.1 TlpA disulfide reductase family protein [Wenyingzhuangia sp. chi5]